MDREAEEERRKRVALLHPFGLADHVDAAFVVPPRVSGRAAVPQPDKMVPPAYTSFPRSPKDFPYYIKLHFFHITSSIFPLQYYCIFSHQIAFFLHHILILCTFSILFNQIEIKKE